MEQIMLDKVLTKLRVALEQGDLGQATAVIEALHPADQADLVATLETPDQVALFAQLAPSDSAGVLEGMHDEDAAALAELLSPGDLTEILDEMDANAAADVLGDLTSGQAAEALRRMEEPQYVVTVQRLGKEAKGRELI